MLTNSLTCIGCCCSYLRSRQLQADNEDQVAKDEDRRVKISSLVMVSCRFLFVRLLNAFVPVPLSLSSHGPDAECDSSRRYTPFYPRQEHPPFPLLELSSPQLYMHLNLCTLDSEPMRVVRISTQGDLVACNRMASDVTRAIQRCDMRHGEVAPFVDIMEVLRSLWNVLPLSVSVTS